MIQHGERIVGIDLGSRQCFSRIGGSRLGRINQYSHMLIEISSGKPVGAKVLGRQQRLQERLIGRYPFDNHILERALGAAHGISVVIAGAGTDELCQQRIVIRVR